MPALDILLAQLPLFAFVGVRVAGVFLVAPVFGSPMLPRVVRVWIGLLLALVFLPLARGAVQSLPAPGVAWVPLLAQELAVGVLLGYVVSVALSAGTYAGRLAGTHIGFGLANIIDPLTSDQATLLDQLQGLLIVLLFLMLGGHRTLLHALGTSLSLVPPGRVAISSDVFAGVLSIFTHAVLLGVQIAIPVLASVFLTELAVGIVSRGVPQFSIFNIGLPLRIIVGLFVFAVTIPLSLHFMKRVILGLPLELNGLLARLAS